MPGEDNSVEPLLDNLRERTLSFEEEFKEAHSRALRLLRKFHAKFSFSQDPPNFVRNVFIRCLRFWRGCS